MFYISSFVALSFVSMLNEMVRSDRALRLVALLYVILFLALIAGLRDGALFPDYENYQDLFDQSPTFLDWVSGEQDFPLDKRLTFEPLYRALNALVQQFTSDPVWLFFTVAVLTVGITGINYARYSPYFLLSMLIYFSHFFLYKELIQIRSGLASAILLFAIPHLEERRLLRFAAVVTIASLIHVGSLIFIPLYVITAFDFRKGFLLGVLLACIAITFVPWLDSVFSVVLGKGSLVFVKVVTYYGNEGLSRDLGLFDPTNLKQVMLSVAFILMLDRLRGRLPYAKTLVYLYLAGTYWRLMFNEFAILAARIASFFTITEAILVPALILCVRERRIAYAMVVLYALLTLFLNVSYRQVVKGYAITPL